MANVARIRRVLDRIEDNPQMWNQEVWGFESECGTQFCFAGFGLLDAGYQYVPAESGYGWGFFVTPEGEEVHQNFSGHGAKAFGLTPEQANRLFYEYPDTTDVAGFRYFVSQVVGHNFYCLDHNFFCLDEVGRE